MKWRNVTWLRSLDILPENTVSVFCFCQDKKFCKGVQWKADVLTMLEIPLYLRFTICSSFSTEISSITWKKYRGPYEISRHPFSHASKDVIKISVKFKGTNFKNLELWRHFCWISLRHCKMPVYKSWRIN